MCSRAIFANLEGDGGERKKRVDDGDVIRIVWGCGLLAWRMESTTRAAQMNPFLMSQSYFNMVSAA